MGYDNLSGVETMTTTVRHIRIDDATWQLFVETLERHNEKRSLGKHVAAALQNYVEQGGPTPLYKPNGISLNTRSKTPKKEGSI